MGRPIPRNTVPQAQGRPNLLVITPGTRTRTCRTGREHRGHQPAARTLPDALDTLSRSRVGNPEIALSHSYTSFSRTVPA
ncbi:hypothetical protein GCM10027059_50340 [Myceligenerans halotolerans]